MAAPAGRVAISLTAGERSVLKALATQRSEPEATTAARLVRAGLVEGGAVLDRPPARRRGPEAGAPAAAPSVGRATAIALLIERYPVDLPELREQLRGDRLVLERLAALAHWRDLLDAEAPAEPRSELAFHAELLAVAKWLEERGRRRR